MQGLQPVTKQAAIPRRAGPRRVVVHIVLFAFLGALCLGLGILGRQKLAGKTTTMEHAQRVDLFLNNGNAALKAAFGELDLDSAVLRQLDTGMSSKKRGLKDTVSRMVEADNEDGDIAAAVIATFSEGALNRVGDEALRDRLQTVLAGNQAALVDTLAQEAEQFEAGFTIARVRMSLQVTEPYYPLMYYYMPLIALGAFLLLMAAVLLSIYLRADLEKRAQLGSRLEPMDYLLPFFVGVALFTLYPIVRVVIMSFQERYRLEGSFTGWGLGNYDYVINGVPGTTNLFVQGLSNTLLYVLFTVPIATVLAIIIAYLLNQKLRFSALFQTTYFLPMVTSVTAVGLVWRWIFNRNFGVLNAILHFFGVSPVDWLQQASNSMTVMVIFGVWSSLPFTIILLLSGLQNIDDTFYTVARVDGARAFRIFRRITVPLLAPTISLVLIINSISAFKVFTDVKVLFGGYPGPVFNMYTMVYYIYDMMYEYRELGRAAAAAIILFVFIFAFTMLQRFIQRKWKYD